MPILTGFGISVHLFENSSLHVEDILGFPRVKDPLYLGSHNVSLTNDTYSFGFALIRALTGEVYQTQNDFEDWVHKLKPKNFMKFVDRHLHGEFPPNLMREVLMLGKTCIIGVRPGRPSMESIVRKLEFISDGADTWGNNRRNEEGRAGTSQGEPQKGKHKFIEKVKKWFK